MVDDGEQSRLKSLLPVINALIANEFAPARYFKRLMGNAYAAAAGKAAWPDVPTPARAENGQAG
jgi:hypothetical protein